jgi:hypothetical protein
VGICGAYPIALARARELSADTGESSSRISPSLRASPRIDFSSVDFPAPFGPMIASHPPAGTDTLTPDTTRVAP